MNMSTDNYPMEMVAICDITRDPELQVRVELDRERVAGFAELIGEGRTLPPVTLFRDLDGVNWLADGFHTTAAHEKADKTKVPAKIRQGSRRDAFLYSRRANGQHGLPLNNKDKRKAVESMLKDEELRQWSDRRVAEHIGCVSHTFVGSVRKELYPNGRSKARRRIGRDGRETRTEAIGRRTGRRIGDEPSSSAARTVNGSQSGRAQRAGRKSGVPAVSGNRQQVAAEAFISGCRDLAAQFGIRDGGFRQLAQIALRPTTDAALVLHVIKPVVQLTDLYDKLQACEDGPNKNRLRARCRKLFEQLQEEP